MQGTRTRLASAEAGTGDFDAEAYRLLVESVPDYAIFMLDPSGVVRTWSLGAQRIKGYRAEEIIGRHFSTFYPAHRIAEGWPEHELEAARTVVSWARGFIEMELSGAFKLGGDVEDAYRFGVERLIAAIELRER